jgi:hypothetical protein
VTHSFVGLLLVWARHHVTRCDTQITVRVNSPLLGFVHTLTNLLFQFLLLLVAAAALLAVVLAEGTESEERKTVW